MEHLLYNSCMAVRGLVGSLVCIMIAIVIGRRCLQCLRLQCEPLTAFIVSAGLGATLLSITATVLTFFHLAYPSVMICVLAFFLFLCRASILTIKQEITGSAFFWHAGGKTRYLFFVPALFLAYAFLCALVAPYCTDTLAYHLVIPRDVLRDHAFEYNFFSYQSGLTYGWHFFGIYSYVLGGARGFICLTAWAFAGVLFLVFSVFANRYSAKHGIMASVICSLIIHLALAENDKTGIDIPLALAEALCLLTVAGAISGSHTSRYALLGIFLGFALSIKMTAVSGLLFLFIMIAATSEPGTRLKAFGIVSLFMIPQALFWPVITFLNTGSPMPQFLLALRTQGPPLPQLSESLFHDSLFYKEQFRHFFLNSSELKTVALIILSGSLALLANKKFYQDKAIKILAGYSLTRWVVMGIFSSITWFHIRYNLPGILAMGMLSSLGWGGYIAKRLSVTKKIVTVSVILFFFMLWSPINFVWGTFGHLSDFLAPPGARTSHVPTFNWISKNLPENAIIAGPAIETYYARRKYVQMQGISQEKINLLNSSENILSELKKLGVTHLHISNEYDLPPWNVTISAKWLANYNKIPDVENLESLYKISYNDPLSRQFITEQIFSVE